MLLDLPVIKDVVEAADLLSNKWKVIMHFLYSCSRIWSDDNYFLIMIVVSQVRANSVRIVFSLTPTCVTLT